MEKMARRRMFEEQVRAEEEQIAEQIAYHQQQYDEYHRQVCMYITQNGF